MRNLRKLTAVVMAIALVLTSMTAAFAADSTAKNAKQAATLKDLGLYAGTDDKDVSAGLTDKLTTEQSLVFLAKLFGYKDKADKLKADEVTEALKKFDDADKISDYAKNVVAYSAINSILSGNKTKTGLFVGPTDTVTGARFATFILKQLGYEVPDYKEAASQLGEVKGCKADDESGDLTRDDAVGVMYGVLTAENSKGDAVISGIIGTDAKLTKIAKDAGLLPGDSKGDLSVASVKSTQLNQVAVEFSGKVDKALVEDEEKYSIDDEDDMKFKSAELQEDGKTVILTLDDEFDEDKDKVNNDDTTKKTPDGIYDNDKSIKDLNDDGIIDDFKTFDNSEEYTLVVDKSIVDTEEKFTPVDPDLPVAESIKLTGPDTFEVTFSEPISAKSMTANDSHGAGYTGDLKVKIQDDIYEGTCKANNSNVVEVTMDSASLDEGKYNVQISGAEDFAGHAALLKKFELEYVKDKTAPEPKLISATQTEVKIDFGKKVDDGDGADLDKNYFYHTTAKYMPDKVEWDGTKVTLTFTNEPLPTGKDVKVGVNYDGGDGDGTVTDKWGNEMAADAIFYTDITADNEKPYITKVEVNEQNEIELFFNESLGEKGSEYADGKTLDTDWFTLFEGDKESDNDIRSAVYDDDDNSITLIFEDDLDGTYKIECSDFTDASVDENEVDSKASEFVADDISGINADKITVSAIDDTESGESYDELVVRFPDDMKSEGSYSVLDLSNYQVNYGKGFVDFDEDDKATFLNGADTVKITIANEDDQTVNNGKCELKIGKVSDKAGNTSIGSVIKITDDKAPKVTKAEMTSYKTIEVTFDGVVKTAPANGFKVTTTGTANDVVSQVSLENKEDDNDNDYTVAKLTLKSSEQLGEITVQNPNVDPKVKADTEKYDATNFAGKVINVEIVKEKVKSDTGKYIAPITGIDVKDAIKPVLCNDNDEPVVKYDDGLSTTDDKVSGASIMLTFTEDLKDNGNGVYDITVKDEDGDKLKAGTDFTITVVNNTLTINIKKSVKQDDIEDYTVLSVTDPDLLTDNAGNAIKAFSALRLGSYEHKN